MGNFCFIYCINAFKMKIKQKRIDYLGALKTSRSASGPQHHRRESRTAHHWRLRRWRKFCHRAPWTDISSWSWWGVNSSTSGAWWWHFGGRWCHRWNRELGGVWEVERWKGLHFQQNYESILTFVTEISTLTPLLSNFLGKAYECENKITGISVFTLWRKPEFYSE